MAVNELSTIQQVLNKTFNKKEGDKYAYQRKKLDYSTVSTGPTTTPTTSNI